MCIGITPPAGRRVFVHKREEENRERLRLVAGGRRARAAASSAAAAAAAAAGDYMTTEQGPPVILISARAGQFDYGARPERWAVHPDTCCVRTHTHTRALYCRCDLSPCGSTRECWEIQAREAVARFFFFFFWSSERVRFGRVQRRNGIHERGVPRRCRRLRSTWRVRYVSDFFLFSSPSELEVIFSNFYLFIFFLVFLFHFSR